MGLEELKFIDAQTQTICHPKTFTAPTQKELDAIEVDSIVKVCIGDERFWTEVTKVDGKNITAFVNNDLVHTDRHGLVFRDKIEFETRHIYQIYD